MKSTEFIAAVDIGSSRIRLLVADTDGENLRIIAHYSGRSAGVHNGLIVDVAKVSEAIEKGISAIHENPDANLRLSTLRANITDPEMKSGNERGKIQIKNAVVKKSDIEAAVENALAMDLAAGRQILHKIAKRFIINEKTESMHPLGASASVLGVDVHWMDVREDNARNVQKSIENCGVGCENIALDIYVLAEVLLAEDEKRKGACLIDLGAETTGIAVYQQGQIVHSAVLPFGVENMTDHIADAYSTTKEEARRLKEQHGFAYLAKILGDERVIHFHQTLDKNQHSLSTLDLAEIVEAGYRKIFTAIRENLKSANIVDAPGVFVFTGGGSRMPGLAELAVDFFRRNAKLASCPAMLKGREEICQNPTYASAVSLLLFEKNDEMMMDNHHKKAHVLSRILDWFKTF